MITININKMFIVCIILPRVVFGFHSVFFRICTHIIMLLGVFLCDTAQAQRIGSKVVMISLDGTPDYLIDIYLKTGVLPSNGAFARMKKYGAYAETVFPVNIASTGPSHISIFTGASPAKTGMVGNSFRKNDDNWIAPQRSAFNEPIGTETIFQAAMRQGKKVISLGAVGVDGSTANRSTDYLHKFPEIVGPSLVIDLVRTDTLKQDQHGKYFTQLKDETTSPSKPVFEVSGVFKIPLYIYRSDSVINEANILRSISQFIVDTDSIISNGYSVALIPDEWSIIKVEKNGKQYNASFKLLNIDYGKGIFRLFMSAPAEVYGSPSGFLQKLQLSCGLWPGEPENRKHTTGLISDEIWFEQIDRLAKYYRDLILASIKEPKWDLLFGYFSTLDDVQHRFTLTNVRQLDYKAENGNRPARYNAYLEKWFQTVDLYLLEIMNAAPKETNFVIFSDHGMIPIHTTIVLNNYFEKEGFKVSESKVKCISSGNAAHIYLNKEKIINDEFNTYLNRLKKSLISLKDPETGKPLFELVATKDELKQYGLYHNDNSGDLFVSCKPGYSITDRYLPGVYYFVKNSFDPAMFANQNQATKNFLLGGTMNETGRAVHGGLNKIRELQSIFYVIGPDVPKRKLKNISSLQIAASVSDLLRIQPPSDAEGKSVFKK